MERAISNFEIRKNINCNIIKHSNLRGIRSLEQLFKNYGSGKKKKPCIILYDFPNTEVGHWVLIMDVGRRIEFFDPYGNPPDYYYKDASMKLLSNLMNQCSAKYYNNFQFQKFSKDISTCGKWCVLRAVSHMKYKMSLMDFIALFSLSENKDRALDFLYRDFLDN